MDTISIDFNGEDLEIEKLIDELSELSTAHVARRGDTHRTTYGEIGTKKTPGPFETSSITFDSPWLGLEELFGYLRRKQIAPGRLGIEQIGIGVIMERQGQINGELSEIEIRMMSELGAHYYWSAYLVDEDEA